MRIKIIAWISAFLFLLLFIGVLNLSFIQGHKYQELSDKNCIRLLPQEGSRGRILDRNNNIIVDNSLSYDVMVLPQENKEQLKKTLLSLSDMLGVNLDKLQKKFKSGSVSVSMPVEVAKNIDIKKAFVLEESKMDLPGLIVQPHPLRHYPHNRLASHVLGYLNEIDRWRLTKLVDYGYKTKDIVGFGGIEEQFDYYLRQEDGGLSVEVDHKGRFRRIVGFKAPQSGKDIQLTLDCKLQKIVEDAIEDRKGSVVILDPSNGEIVAMASNPDFSPTVFVKRSSSIIRNLFRDSDGPLFNRAISGGYPAGSIFKMIVATAALENNKIKKHTSFSCEGVFNLGQQDFACWDTHGLQDLIAAITHSCNVFFYRTGLLVGPELIHEYALKFGLAKQTGVELPYETAGFIPDPLWKKISRLKNWFNGDTVNLSIGQGDVLVSPLQAARMIAVFANKGSLVYPHIIKSIDGKDVSADYRRLTSLSLKPATMDYIREGLRQVVVDPAGTANVLAELPVSVAGKTGTAQVSRGQPHAWFVGFFPFNEAKFAICVFLENGGAGHGSASLAAKIIDVMIKEDLL